MAELFVLSAAIRDQLSRWFDGKDIISPSINYAVFDRTGVLFHHGIGEFQRDGRPPELDTIYRICSLSKKFLRSRSTGAERPWSAVAVRPRLQIHTRVPDLS